MSRFEIKMPKLGESITEGTIVSWSVQVGDVIKEDDRLDAVDCGLAHLHHLRVRGQTICLEHLVGELGIEVLGAGHALEDRTGVQANTRMARAGREAIALGEIARTRNGAGHLVQAARTALDGQNGTQKTAGVLVYRVSEQLLGGCLLDNGQRT